MTSGRAGQSCRRPRHTDEEGPSHPARDATPTGERAQTGRFPRPGSGRRERRARSAAEVLARPPGLSGDGVAAGQVGERPVQLERPACAARTTCRCGSSGPCSRDDTVLVHDGDTPGCAAACLPQLEADRDSVVVGLQTPSGSFSARRLIGTGLATDKIAVLATRTSGERCTGSTLLSAPAAASEGGKSSRTSTAPSYYGVPGVRPVAPGRSAERCESPATAGAFAGWTGMRGTP